VIDRTFRPSKSFERVGHVWVKGEKAASAWVGPSAAAIGWIPFYLKRGDLAEGFLKKHWPDDPSIPLLLGSGNSAPPEWFSNADHFERHLDTLDFRGAIALNLPTLYLDKTGNPHSFYCMAMARVGTTVIRPGQVSKKLKSVQLYLGGISSSSGSVSSKPGRVEIKLFMRLKLGFLGRAVAAVKTGTWPPWATMMIDYAFDLEKAIPTASARFVSTAIPSISRYVGWKQESLYALEEELSGAGYNGFVEAGGCKDALAEADHEASFGLMRTDW